MPQKNACQYKQTGSIARQRRNEKKCYGYLQKQNKNNNQSGVNNQRNNQQNRIFKNTVRNQNF